MKKIGKYNILGEIGHGAMGVVYKALDPLIERVVAIKTMSTDLDAEPELRARFMREARSAGRLSHKNIVTIYDLGEEDGKAYMAMEYLDGEDLNSRIIHRQRASLERKVRLMHEILEGLAHAHNMGVIHRDIKPGNIFLTRSGQVKILDFGLARIASSDITKTGAVMGTPNYMSPEQIRSDATDHRSDLFSVGATFYEILTYRKPFHSSSLPATLFKILQEDPEPPSSVDPTIPQKLSDIVMRALEKDPAQRYQTAEEMILELDEFGRTLDERKREIRQETEQALGALNRLIAENQDAFSFDIQGETIAESPVLAQGGSAPSGDETQTGLMPDSEAGYDQILQARDQAKREIHRLTGLLEAHQKAKSLLLEAEALEKKGELEEALALAGKIPPDMYRRPDVAAFHARVRLALAEIERERERQRQMTSLLEQARHEHADGRLPESLSSVEALLALDPSHAEANALRADISRRLEEARIARERAEKAEGLFRSAEALFSKGELEGAEAQVQKALELAPEHEAAQALSRRVLQQLEERAAAEERRRKAGEALAAARSALTGGKLALARREVERALAIEPEAAGASDLLEQVESAEQAARAERERRQRIADLLGQGRARVEAGRDEEALALLATLLNLDPHNEAGLALKHSILEKREAEARREKEKQERISSRLQLIRQAKRAGELEGAIELAKAILAEDAGHAEASRLLEDLEEARRRKAREELEQKGRDLVSKAADFAAREEFARAAAMLEQAEPALRELPGVKRAFDDYVRKAGEQEEARRRAEQEKKDRIRILLEKARNSASSGSLKEAIELASSALKEEKENKDALRLLDSFREEEKRIRRAREEREQKTRELVSRAERLSAEGKFDEAAALLSAADTAIAAASSVQECLARSLKAIRDREEARRKAEQEKAERIRALSGRMSAAWNAREIEKTIELAKTLLAEDSSHSEARRLLPEALRQLAARELEQKVMSLLSRAKSHADNGQLEKAAAVLDGAEPDAASHRMVKETLSGYREAIRRREEARLRAERIAQHLENGKRAFDEGNCARCEEELARLLSLEPNHAEAKELLERARAEIKRRQAEEERRKRISEAVRAAQDSFTRGKLDDALADAGKALSLDPANQEAVGLRNRIETRRREIREQESRRSEAKHLFETAVRLSVEKDFASALQALNKACALWPELPGAAKLTKRIEREKKRSRLPKPQPQAAAHRHSRLAGAALLAVLTVGAGFLFYRHMNRPAINSSASASPEAPAGAPAGAQAGAGKSQPAQAAVQLPSPPLSPPQPAAQPDGLTRTPGSAVEKKAAPQADLSAEIESGNKRAKQLIDSGRYEEAMKAISSVLRLAPKDREAQRLLGQIEQYAKQGADQAMNEMSLARSKAEQAQAGTLAKNSFDQAGAFDTQAMKLYQARDYGSATPNFFEAAQAYRRAESEANTRSAEVAQERVKTAQRSEAESSRQSFSEFRTKAAAAGADKMAPDSFREAANLAAKAQSLMEKGDYSGARSVFEEASKAMQSSADAATGQRQAWDSLKSGKDLTALQGFLKKYPASPFADQARQRIEEVEWQSVDRKDPAALRSFLSRNPKSSFAQQAQSELQKLEHEQQLDADQGAIQQVIAGYASAFSHMNLREVQAAWPGIPGDTLGVIQRTFKNARAMEMRLEPLKTPSISGGTATVVCRREIRQTFRDGATPPPVQDTVTIRLVKAGSAWVIQSIQ